MGIVTEEADECVFWIELLSDLGIVKKEKLHELLQEARELTAIFNASRQTAKQRNDFQFGFFGNIGIVGNS